MEQNLKGKLPPAVTYNRPPTQQRAPDPGRFRSIDVLPENAQNDPDYQRMVRDIEALQQRQGWLAGRGAFDKEDLLYLRDREQQERLTEQEQRDMEAAAYAAARARIEQQQQEAANARLRAAAAAKQSRPQSRTMAPVVKVKKHHSHDKQQEQSQHQQHADPDHQQGGRESKRQKVLDGVDHAAATAVDGFGVSHPDHDSAHVSKTSIQQAPDHQQQQQLQKEDQPPVGVKVVQDNGPAPGLEGLLGVYGSESESEEDRGAENMKQQRQQQGQGVSHQQTQQGQPVQLPSAAELLEQELHSSLAPVPAAEAETDTPEVHEVGEAGTAYQQHTAWI